MISTTQSNNSPAALRKYREGWDRAFGVKCKRCGGFGYVYTYEHTGEASYTFRDYCPRCSGTGREPEATHA